MFLAYVAIHWYSIWIGLSSVNGGQTWIWSDGSSIDYMLWKTAPPTNNNGAILYGVMESNNEKNLEGMNAYDFKLELPFICKKSL